ncbi:MAG: tRNA lysidine(34) synthetase TilS [Alphaproteobacteria bacterium]|nr:tRNA lysidine(34) synthetase TilS [Alphaproteobacteria bacterium]
MQNFLKKYQLQNEVIAAGVSGGADSLALVLRLKDCGAKVVALTVDHGLRPSSAKEAEYVAELMKKNEIEHHVLTWEGEKPLTGIEAAARKARYALLFAWCKEHGIKYLAVGHHRRDQAETFLLRLQRGSGLFGLCGMAMFSRQDDMVVVRPQLYDDPDDLRKYLQEKNVDWVEDESNLCDDFQRVRIRKFLSELEAKIGISEKRLANTALVLQRTRNYFEEEVEKRIKNHVRQWGDRVFSFSAKVISDWHAEIVYRFLAELLCRCGRRPYAPEAEELLRLIDCLKNSAFKGCTLNGCEIFVAQKRLWVVPEDGEAQVLTKIEWDKFVQVFPQYANLPYKVRRALYNDMKKV